MSSDILTAVLVELAEFHATGYHFIKLNSQDAESFIKDNPVLKPNTIYDVFSEQACKMVDQSFVAGMTATNRLFGNNSMVPPNRQFSLGSEEKNLVNPLCQFDFAYFLFYSLQKARERTTIPFLKQLAW